MTNSNSLLVAFRFAFREFRGGLSGFRILIACIALGVAAIAAVGSTTRGITQGISSEGATILGGDMTFSLVQRAPKPEELAFLSAKGKTSSVTTVRSMARRADGKGQTLIAVKAVDAAYPLVGAITLNPEMAISAALVVDGQGRYGVAVEPLLLARLEIKVGDPLMVGRASMVVRATIANEPDKIGSGIDLGPRVMMSAEALAHTGLIQPGSIYSTHTRLLLQPAVADGALADLKTAAASAFPEAGWEITSRDNASPGLKRNVERFAQFLTLVGLTALVVGGVGVANAVKAYIDRKRDSIAAFKALGAPGGFVVLVYLLQILMITTIGILIGLGLGLVVTYFGGDVIASALKLPIRIELYPVELLLAALYGFLTALAFALWSLGRAHDIPVSALFRDRIAPDRRWPRAVYVVSTVVAVLVLAAMAIFLAFDRMIALYFVVAIVLIFLALGLVARGVMALATRAPTVRSTGLRLAIRNIHRPGGLTYSVILSLGLGLTLLVTLALIDGSLRRQLTSTLPERAPSFFFLDLQSAEKDGFFALLNKTVPGVVIDDVPMLRGRITALNGIPVDKIDAPANVRWALDSDRGITFANSLPKSSSLASGEWWPADYSGEPLVSFEDELASGLGLKIGDHVTVNVLGRNVVARIANTRHLEWESMSINFVMVFSPNSFGGAPYSVLATASLPDRAMVDQEAAVLNTVTNAYPTVTAVAVKNVLSAVNDLVGQLVVAIRAAASIALIASVLVLAGALASGHRQRIYDAVLMKTFGATRRSVLSAFVVEYLLLGLAAGLFGLIAGSAAAFGVLKGIMDINPVIDPFVALAAVGIALACTVGFGLAGTWRILGQKAAPVLRNL